MPRRSCWRAFAETFLVAGLSTPAVAEDVAVFAAASMKNALESYAAKWQALELSLRVSIVATAANLPFGILAAYALARWRFRSRQVLNVLVHLPLVLTGVIAGAIMAFAKAMGEFGATITFVSNIPGQTQTPPTAIYTLQQVPGDEADAARLALVSVGMAMAALLLSKWLSRAVARRIAGT